MSRLLVLSVLLVVAAVAHETGKEHKHRPHPIKGVSKENFMKLREAMKSESRKTAEERKEVVQTWLATLPEEEKKAAEAHLEQMKKRREQFKKRAEAKKGERKERKERKEKGDEKRDEKKGDKEDRKERRHEKRGERQQERKERREEKKN